MELSPELVKIVDAIIGRISVDGRGVEVKNINYGAFEQILDAYAAVKIRRIALTDTFEDQHDSLMGYADLVQAGMF